jgi:hypothetical protein
MSHSRERKSKLETSLLPIWTARFPEAWLTAANIDGTGLICYMLAVHMEVWEASRSKWASSMGYACGSTILDPVYPAKSLFCGFLQARMILSTVNQSSCELRQTHLSHISYHTVTPSQSYIPNYSKLLTFKSSPSTCHQWESTKFWTGDTFQNPPLLQIFHPFNITPHPSHQHPSSATPTPPSTTFWTL